MDVAVEPLSFPCYAARMGWSEILGQETALATLTGALRRGRVHHAYRFEGPDGVGKELAAFALASALVCTGGDPLGCGRCDACRRATTFSKERPESPLHPDVAIVAKNFYPPEAIGRSRAELTEISVDQIRKIVLSHAAYPPHEGRARVFIVRRAEEMNASAANALLKTLEEPRASTHFILLSSRSDRLLDTIRSRTMPIRFAPLGDSILRGILAKHGVPAERHDLAVELAGGSASLALELCDDEATKERDAFVDAVFACVAARDLGPAVALSEAGEKDREVVRANLRALGAALARKARAASADSPRTAGVLAKQYDAVNHALAAVDRNASSGLTLIALVNEMREAS